MNKFIERILNTLEENGFPEKKVSLPTEKLYEAADNKGLSFNKVMDQIKETTAIDIQVGDEKIIFSKSVESPAENASPLGDISPDMLKQAQEMLGNMDPAELQKMQDMFMNMSEEEKEEILKKGKDLGLS